MRLVVVGVAFFLMCTAAVGAEYPGNEIPMYGGIEKTPAMIEADEKFISAIAESGISKEEAARHLAKRGWQSFSQKDISTAIKRFNQSWLLYPYCYETYWGFALVYLLRDGDIANADTMFAEALSLKPDVGNFYVEYGRFTAENKPGSLENAIALFQKGLEMDPRIRDGYIGLIRSYSKKKDNDSVRQWYEQGKTQGVFSTDEIRQFEDMLLEASKE